MMRGSEGTNEENENKEKNKSLTVTIMAPHSLHGQAQEVRVKQKKSIKRKKPKKS